MLPTFVTGWSTLTRRFTPTTQQLLISCSLTQQADEESTLQLLKMPGLLTINYLASCSNVLKS